jgi:hypothetical protein
MAKRDMVAVVVKVTEDFDLPVSHREVFGVFSDIAAAEKWVEEQNALKRNAETASARFWMPEFEVEIKELS